MPGLYKFLFSIHYTRGAILGSPFFVRLSYIPLIQPFYWFFLFFGRICSADKKILSQYVEWEKIFQAKVGREGGFRAWAQQRRKVKNN